MTPLDPIHPNTTPNTTRNSRLLKIAAVALGGLGLGVWILAGARAESWRPVPAGGGAPNSGAGAITGTGAGTGAGVGGFAGSLGMFAQPAAGAALASGARTVVAPSARVRVVFRTTPSVAQATVTWGRKRLGIIKPRAALVIDRARDSGPLDVVVRSDGYLPVHSRVYTFTDSVMNIKLTPVDQVNTLFGYREAPPPDEDAGTAPDGGPAPAAATDNPDGGAP